MAITKETFHPADPYNLTSEEQTFIDSLSLDELRTVAFAEMDEKQRQAEFQAKVETFKQGNLDRRFEDKTPEEIAEELRRRTEIAELEASPEAKAEENIRNLEQEAKDLQYANAEVRKDTAQIVAAEIARQKAETDRSLEIQLEFCARHENYIRSMDNGNTIRDWGQGTIQFLYP